MNLIRNFGASFSSKKCSGLKSKLKDFHLSKSKFFFEINLFFKVELKIRKRLKVHVILVFRQFLMKFEPFLRCFIT